MSQKYILWLAVIVILFIAAGAVYVATQLSGVQAPPPAPAPPPSPTSELESASQSADRDLSELEAGVQELEAVDPNEDNLGI